MNPLFTEFKRQFSFSMFKNMGLSLGEMSFFKDFIHDTRGDPYPLMDKSEDCIERIGENRYHLLSGFAQRMFCRLFPFATYEISAEKICGEVGFVFDLPQATASVVLVCDMGDTYFSYKCADHTEKIHIPSGVTETSPWLVTLRPGNFDIYYRQKGGVTYLATVDEPRFAESNRYDTFKDSYVSLLARGEVHVSRVTSCLDNGVSIADFRPIRYEDGTVIHEHGRIYFTASVRSNAGNYQAIFSWVPGTMQFEMTGALFFDPGDGFWRNFIASVILYNRTENKWYVWTSSFDHGHILAYGQFDGEPRFGVNVADVTIMEKAGEGASDTEFLGFVGDEDPDLTYDAEHDRWLLAICRIDQKTKQYGYVFFESKEPFRNYRFIGRGGDDASETGGCFVRVDGEVFFVCGNSFERRSEYRIYGKDGMREAQFRYPDGGFRGWGCVIPVSLGSRKRYFWLTFDRHNGSDYNWSYGNIYCFEAPIPLNGGDSM